MTAITETGLSAIGRCQVEREIGRRLSASKAVKPIQGFPPDNFRLPCNAGFYLLDERSDEKALTIVDAGHAGEPWT